MKAILVKYKCTLIGSLEQHNFEVTFYGHMSKDLTIKQVKEKLLASLSDDSPININSIDITSVTDK